jgi:hypothetical protein
MKNESDQADVMVAVFALREAAQAHGRAEAELGEARDAQARDELLRKRLDMEAKTARAIDACSHCGRPHADDPCDEDRAS